MPPFQSLIAMAEPAWETGPLWVVLVLGVLSGLFGAWTFWGRGSLPKSTFMGYFQLFLGWTILMVFLGLRQEACPIHGTGQVLIFLCWSLILFYLFAGGAYRLSFLGGLTGVLVLVFSLFAAIVGIYPVEARPLFRMDLHVGLGILSYAAFALSWVASVALLVQNKHLKQHDLGGSYRKLPKLGSLIYAAPRLVLWGLVLLTASILISLPLYENVSSFKLVAASVTWVGYLLLSIVNAWRGLPPRWFALWNIVMFLIALIVIIASR